MCGSTPKLLLSHTIHVLNLHKLSYMNDSMTTLEFNTNFLISFTLSAKLAQLYKILVFITYSLLILNSNVKEIVLLVFMLKLCKLIVYTICKFK